MSNVNIGGLAQIVLEGKAAEYRKAHPELTEEQAFAKVYSDPANREAAAAERLANRSATAEPMAISTALAKRESAMDALTAKAEELRASHPELSEAQAFAKTYKANRGLAVAERGAARAAIGA